MGYIFTRQKHPSNQDFFGGWDPSAPCILCASKMEKNYLANLFESITCDTTDVISSE